MKHADGQNNLAAICVHAVHFVQRSGHKTRRICCGLPQPTTRGQERLEHTWRKLGGKLLLKNSENIKYKLTRYVTHRRIRRMSCGAVAVAISPDNSD